MDSTCLRNNEEKDSFDYYFDSYSHSIIHKQMLTDQARTLSYQEAIIGNPELFEGKIVLDVGCGTGILSLFAAKAGALRVYGIERSKIAEKAKEIVKKNGYEDTITIISGCAESIELDEKVDVIISEWMGYCLLYESMLPSVLIARDRFLKENGTMFPNQAYLRISGIVDDYQYRRKINFWNSIYGFKMSPYRKWALLEPIIQEASSKQVITDECTILSLNLNTCSVNDLTFSSPFCLNSLDKEVMHCIVAWFDVVFVGPQVSLTLSTSPFSPPTHWCQTHFYLPKVIDLELGMALHGFFSMKPNEKNPRDQDITISTNNNNMTIYRMR